MEQHNRQTTPLSIPTASLPNDTPINDYALRTPDPREWERTNGNLRVVGEQDKVLRRVRSGVLEATEQVNIPHSRLGLLW